MTSLGLPKRAAEYVGPGNTVCCSRPLIDMTKLVSEGHWCFCSEPMVSYRLNLLAYVHGQRVLCVVHCISKRRHRADGIEMDDGVGVGRVVEDLHMTSAPMSCDQGSFPTWAGIITGELINTAQYQNRKKNPRVDSLQDLADSSPCSSNRIKSCQPRKTKAWSVFLIEPWP